METDKGDKMSCKHCPHCIEKAKQEDYENRKSYVETARINRYIPNHSNFTIEEAEQYLIELYGFDRWHRLSFDIPIDKELYKKWSKK